LLATGLGWSAVHDLLALFVVAFVGTLNPERG
jgi:hypothetical protein